MKPRKFLTICHGGQNRSVCLANLIRGHGFEAVSHNASLDAEMQRLQEWADRIVVVQKELADRVFPAYKHKLKVIDIGIDVWGSPSNPDLIALWEGLMGEVLE